MRSLRRADLLLIVLPLVALLARAVQAETLAQPKDALKAILAGGAKTTKITLVPSPDEAKKLKETWGVEDASAAFYLAKDAAGATVKAAILITHQGKEGPITAAIGLDGAKGSITEIILLDFSEERGKPAKEESFLKQFRGKDASQAFKLGKDVDGVAGATWTSETMASIARRAAALYKVLVLDRGSAK